MARPWRPRAVGFPGPIDDAASLMLPLPLLVMLLLTTMPLAHLAAHLHPLATDNNSAGRFRRKHSVGVRSVAHPPLPNTFAGAL